jgi:drug/metabolite transporter (DMT)-like permease
VRGADVARLIALAAIWGASFIFLRVIAPVLGPVLTAALRVLIAGIALVAWARATRFDAELARHWRAYVVIGVVNSSLPFVLYAFAALYLPASYSVILNSVAPLFGALLAWPYLGDPLTLRKLGGLAGGAIGVVLVSGAGPIEVQAQTAAAIAACLAAAFCYAVGGVYIKRCAATAPPMGIAAWSQVFAALALVPLLPFAPPRGTIDAVIVVNMLALSLLCSALAYLLYFRLIADVGPTRALTVTFLMPAFGMLWGTLFLDESITVSMAAGCLLIVGGVALVAIRAAPRAVVESRDECA